MAAKGDLVRIRPGLYWKGPKTTAGMVEPDPMRVGIQIGGSGSGPAGVSAARVFGLTTQVPAFAEVAVPIRIPRPVEGVRFSSRSRHRLTRGLTPTEVALLETLRLWPDISEEPWSTLVSAVRSLIRTGKIRIEVITAVAAAEQSKVVRDLLRDLVANLAP